MALALDDSTPADRPRSARGRRGAPVEAAEGATPGSDARVDALRRVVAEVSANLELDKVFRDVLDSSLTLFGAEVAGLWLLNPGRHPYELVAHRDLDPSLISAVAAITEDDPVIGNRAIAERRPIVLDDPTSAPNFADIYARLAFRTINFVPLVFRDEPVGLLVLYHRRPYDWTPDELELCATFAAQMATAVANARLFNTVREGAARLRAIQELSSRLNRIQDVNGIGETIVSEADRLIAHDTIRVYRVDHVSQLCEPIAFHGAFPGV
ncbi:MAG TPA: GAF domain-containing protein, partial [Candidatus Limnocylindrales bacterium]|nr:GAF domain-containing protein [Candidatus Limnocylindrales bacterium]